jgi:ferric-dicitrate binding protein FerR (iron transport regulator)
VGEERTIAEDIDLLFSGAELTEEERDAIRVRLVRERTEEADTALRSKFDDVYDNNEGGNRAEQLWDGLAARIKRSDAHRALIEELRNMEPEPSRRIPWRRYAAIAVAAAAVVALAIVLWPNRPPVEQVMVAVHDVQAHSATATKVDLPDGTKVWLSDNASLHWTDDFHHAREVKLSGKAWFSVKSDSTRPFIVASDRMTVTVTGTQFELEDDNASAKSHVTLICGSLHVTAHNNKHEAFTLAPNDCIEINHRSGEVARSVVEGITDWRKQTITVDGFSLHDALAHIAESFDLTLDVQRALDTDAQVVMHLNEAMSLHEMLNMIRSATTSFEYELAGDKLIIR